MADVSISLPTRILPWKCVLNWWLTCLEAMTFTLKAAPSATVVDSCLLVMDFQLLFFKRWALYTNQNPGTMTKLIYGATIPLWMMIQPNRLYCNLFRGGLEADSSDDPSNSAYLNWSKHKSVRPGLTAVKCQWKSPTYKYMWHLDVSFDDLFKLTSNRTHALGYLQLSLFILTQMKTKWCQNVSIIKGCESVFASLAHFW